MAFPTVPDFAAGLAAAVGQLSSALKLPTGWVASPSLRWTPSGATLLVRWGPPALGRAPGGGEHSKRKRSAAQQRRSALRAAAHKERKRQQQRTAQHALRPEAPAFSPNAGPPPPPPPEQQQESAAAMEVVQSERVREGGEPRTHLATHRGSSSRRPTQLALPAPPPQAPPPTMDQVNRLIDEELRKIREEIRPQVEGRGGGEQELERVALGVLNRRLRDIT